MALKASHKPKWRCFLAIFSEFSGFWCGFLGVDPTKICKIIKQIVFLFFNDFYDYFTICLS